MNTRVDNPSVDRQTGEADVGFAFGDDTPLELLEGFGSPLYVYDERVLRARCRELLGLLRYRPFRPSYSVKANGNLRLLSIVAEEGLDADAMSPGEIRLLEAAGFTPERILFIPNNVGDEEFDFAVERGITCSMDSLSQLERFATRFSGEAVALRFNPGVGAGHCSKVVTAGAATKFGILPEEADAARALIARARLRLVGINQHIGSGYLEPSAFLAAAERLLTIAGEFPGLEFVDFGGGFGIPYRRRQGESRLDLRTLGASLDAILEEWSAARSTRIEARVEPGRYVVAECGAVLGRTVATKPRGEALYVGTDIGFNVLMRPMAYGSYHEVEFLPASAGARPTRAVHIVGNICETGDVLGRDRALPEPRIGDAVLVHDAGAYGYSMSSSYNARPRAAEVLICMDGSAELIRRRETVDDLFALFPRSSGSRC